MLKRLIRVASPLTVFDADIPFAQLKAKYANEASRFIDIDGLLVHYRDEGTGPTLILLHGILSSLHTWDGWVEELKDRFRLIRLDLPGYGLTGPNQDHDYRLSSYGVFLSKFLEKLGLEKFHIAGNSLGGEIAWQFALAHPDKIDKLILIDALGYRPDKIPRLIRDVQTPVIKDAFKFMTPRFLVRDIIRQVYGNKGKVTPKLVERYRELSMREGNREAFVVRANTPWETNYHMIKGIRNPTLILWGAEDIWMHPDHAEHFFNDIENAELIVYEDVGHMPMEEIPEQTAEDAVPFLLEHSDPTTDQAELKQAQEVS